MNSTPLSFPCFTFLAIDCTNPYVQTVDGKYALLVFSSYEHLREFRRTNADAIGPTVEFDWAGQVALYLESLPKEVTHIAFNPTNTGKTALVDLASVYQSVLNKT